VPQIKPPRLYSPTCGCSLKKIERTQRHPQYSDEELKPFFAEVSAGYCFKQAAYRCGYPWERVNNTLLSDDETMGYCLDLSIAAGGEIRSGHRVAPDRWDGLYDKFLP
jgi:hypothetical protein